MPRDTALNSVARSCKARIIPGDTGVSNALQDRRGVKFAVASGDYTFALTAQ